VVKTANAKGEFDAILGAIGNDIIERTKFVFPVPDCSCRFIFDRESENFGKWLIIIIIHFNIFSNQSLLLWACAKVHLKIQEIT
jgi:hypothetical protein